MWTSKGPAGARRPSVWRQERHWLVLSVLAGLAVGVPFLLAAAELWGSSRHPFALLFAVGGMALLVGPFAWILASTWRWDRGLKKECGSADDQS